jgi:hypothetical protein
MRKYVALSAAALAVVFALSYAVPAVGGPDAFSSASPTRLAKKALKTARGANRRSKQALARLDRKGGFLAATVQTVASGPATIGPQAVGAATANCPPGTVVISGGYSLTGVGAAVFFDHRSANGWSVGVENGPGDSSVTTSAQVTAEAQCVSTGNAVVSKRSSGRADRIRDQRLLERQRALYR